MRSQQISHLITSMVVQLTSHNGFFRTIFVDI